MVVSLICRYCQADQRHVYQYDPDGDRPVIFFTIISGITGAGSMKKVARVGLKAFIYFEVVTTLALIIGLITANVVKPGVGIAVPHTATAQVTEFSQQASKVNWSEFLSHIVPANIFEA